MARVCEEIYPAGFSNNIKDGFSMDDYLKSNLDALLKNASKKDDWDFVFLITGGGRVRIGKSMLAMQIAAYWSYMLNKLYGIQNPFNIEENFVFHGSELIEKGHTLYKKYTQGVLLHDEAGADLEGKKVMRRTTQNVIDYLRECGQYNFLTIIILPEFFDLPKSIATTRSDILIDVYKTVDKTGKFSRGYFNFYSWPNKRKLYLKGKRDLNYKAYKKDFAGTFHKFYPVDEKEYREAKLKALISRKEEEEKPERALQVIERNLSWKWNTENGLGVTELARKYMKEGIKISHQAISSGIATCKASKIL